MTRIFHVRGMTCANCAQKIEKTLSEVPNITSAKVDLSSNQATLTMSQHVSIDELNKKLKAIGNYQLSEQAQAPSKIEVKNDFIPLVVIFSIIVLFTWWRQCQLGFNMVHAMDDFMAAFFLIFGGFKIFNWKGFVESYRTYDLLAKKSEAYAYLYPLIEISLGFSYLFRFAPVPTNVVTFLVMGFSSIGVIEALRSKKKIVCACLGAVFKIPMTQVTLLEDVLMAVMAVIMLFFIGK